MALSTLTSDTFVRTPGSMDGSTLDNGLGGAESDVWVSTGWTIGVLGDRAVGSVTVALVAYPNNMVAVGTQRISAVLGNTSAIGGRYVAADGTYFFIYRQVNDLYLFYWDGASNNQLDLVVNGSTNLADIISIDCTGTTIQMLVNGSGIGTPATDSHNSTGVGCMRSGGSSGFINFQVETDSGTAAWGPQLADRHNRLIITE